MKKTIFFFSLMASIAILFTATAQEKYAVLITSNYYNPTQWYGDEYWNLLSLLPGDGLSETMKQSLSTLKTGELLQNVPNPFNGTTQIWFKIETESSVAINVFDLTGKLIRTLNQGIMDKGTNHVEFSAKGLSSGIYFYSMEVNGIKTDTKKMTILNDSTFRIDFYGTDRFREIIRNDINFAA